MQGASFKDLTTPQQLVFLVVTADAQQLGLNLSDYQFAGITIAGVDNATQTELNLNVAPGVSESTAIQDLTSSFGANLSAAGRDTMHGVYNVGNYRQNVPQWSMQITSSASGNIQIDIDPFNPKYLRAFLGHLYDVVTNTLSGSDTNYNNVANAISKRYPKISIFNCP